MKQILKLPTKKRNQEFAKLRRKGDYADNILKLQKNNLNITVVRSGKHLNDYTVCTTCYGFFSARTLVKHVKSCDADSESMRKKVDGVKCSKMFLASVLAIDVKYDTFSADIIARMTNDQYTNLVKNDQLMRLYGYTMYEKGGDDKFNEISNKLRNVARLIVLFREKFGTNISMCELIDPIQWDAIIDTVKCLVKHGGNEHVGIPSLLLRLGRSLEALASAKRALGIKTKNEDMTKDARDFLALHEESWHVYSNHALATISAKKDKAPELLPLTEDIQNLREFLLSEIRKIVNVFEKSNSDNFLTRSDYSYLQKLIIVRIITFNARRGGEPAKIKMEDWLDCNKWKRQEDINNLIDPCERLLAARLKLIYSKGKRKKRDLLYLPMKFKKALIYC